MLQAAGIMGRHGEQPIPGTASFRGKSPGTAPEKKHKNHATQEATTLTRKDSPSASATDAQEACQKATAATRRGDTLGSQWQTMLRQFVRGRPWSLAFALIVLCLPSCQSTGGASGADAADELDSNSAEADDHLDNENAFGEVAHLKRAPHPKEATAWETRKLLLSSKLPPAESLNACQEELRAMASDAGSEDDMRQLQRRVGMAARRDPQLYHWCFYRMVSLIDWSLEKDEGVLPREKMPRFFSRMKALWALARSLDDIYRTRLYFSYLRIRYMQISRDYFGRSLDVVTGPLGTPHNGTEKSKSKRGKATGGFDDNDLDF